MFRSPTILMALLLLPLFIKSCTSNSKDNDSQGTSSAPAKLDLLAANFTAPLAMVEIPGTGHRLVADQTGEIWLIDRKGKVNEKPFLDLSGKLVNLNRFYDERGLLGLALHPQFAQNRKFYVYYSAPLRASAPSGYDHTSIISEYTVSTSDPASADPASERIVMAIDQPQGNHNGGCLAFGPDGNLYIATGDGGDANDSGLGHAQDWYERNPGGNGQNITANLHGAILRINPDGNPYTIPSDNPFVEQEGLDEIYAYGLRNPFRFSFDRENGTLISSDVGQELWEEISVIKKGGNYGWNVKEGRHCFDASNPTETLDNCPETDPRGNQLIDPVIEIKNSKNGGETVSLIGGYIYRGEQQADWKGKYIFGSWSGSGSENGKLFIATPDQTGTWEYTELDTGASDMGLVLSFAEGAKGELYVLTTENRGPTGKTGKIHQLTSQAAQ